MSTDPKDDQRYGMVEAISHLVHRDYAEIGHLVGTHGMDGGFTNGIEDKVLRCSIHININSYQDEVLKVCNQNIRLDGLTVFLLCFKILIKRSWCGFRVPFSCMNLRKNIHGV